MLDPLTRAMRREQLNRRQILASLLAAAGCKDILDIHVEPIGGLQVTEDGNLALDPITSNEDFYVYACCGGAPDDLDVDAWRCSLQVRGGERAVIDYRFLMEREPTEIELTLECIGNDARGSRIGNAVWGGLPLIDVLEALGVVVPPSAVEIRLLGDDGYDASIPASDVEREQVWLIWEMNGAPLPRVHGGPARLMVPGRYGIKNIKWIREIDFVDERYDGYWDKNGPWSHGGEYLPNAFILSPFWEEVVSAPVTVVGVAFAGTDPVVKVEVTFDGGKTFADAILDYSPGPDRWVIWRYVWSPGPGSYLITARVTTASGRRSQLSGEATDPLQGFDSCVILPVTVT